jgi:hypothetical protein
MIIVSAWFLFSSCLERNFLEWAPERPGNVNGRGLRNSMVRDGVEPAPVVPRSAHPNGEIVSSQRQNCSFVTGSDYKS